MTRQPDPMDAIDVERERARFIELHRDEMNVEIDDEIGDFYSAFTSNRFQGWLAAKRDAAEREQKS